MSVDLMFQQANAAHRAGAWAQAEAQYLELRQHHPLFANHNLGVVYVATGRFAEAEAAFRAALAIDPDCAAPRHSLGALLLAEGRYSDGWPLHEARRELPQLGIPRPSLPYPEWTGQDLAGKRLLVVYEQGLGDQIQLARLAPILAARGAEVILTCSPPLARLFRGLAAQVLPVTPGFVPPRADYWALIHSLPLRMGLTLESLPNQPYLAGAAAISTGGGVGVVARGAPSHVNDRFRSLQGDDAAALLAPGRDLAPEATGADDFQDTAEIVGGLDLVIAVDTSVAHLAGAMGKPVWILLSAVETDWRWLRNRTDSPWHPSARLYRQASAGVWAPVLAQVRRDLAALGLDRR